MTSQGTSSLLRDRDATGKHTWVITVPKEAVEGHIPFMRLMSYCLFETSQVEFGFVNPAVVDGFRPWETRWRLHVEEEKPHRNHLDMRAIAPEGWGFRSDIGDTIVNLERNAAFEESIWKFWSAGDNADQARTATRIGALMLEWFRPMVHAESGDMV